VLLGKGTDAILGATIVGEHAEMISEVSRNGLRLGLSAIGSTHSSAPYAARRSGNGGSVQSAPPYASIKNSLGWMKWRRSYSHGILSTLSAYKLPQNNCY
jgi:hypothetical protein